jgi:hypothetical protein
MSRKYLRKKREIRIWRSLWTLAMSAPTQYTIHNTVKNKPRKE